MYKFILFAVIALLGSYIEVTLYTAISSSAIISCKHDGSVPDDELPPCQHRGYDA